MDGLAEGLHVLLAELQGLHVAAAAAAGSGRNAAVLLLLLLFQDACRQLLLLGATAARLVVGVGWERVWREAKVVAKGAKRKGG